MCSVVREYHMGKQIIGVEMFDGKLQSSPLLTVLYKGCHGEITAGEVAAGNNIAVFDKDFNTVFELNDTQYHYTTVFKWINPFDVPNAIHIALAVVMSRRIHLMAVNTVQVP